MRVVPQVSVSTTPTWVALYGVKFLRVTVGAVAVLVAINHTLNETAEGDFITLAINGVYRISAPKGKLIYGLVVKTASGTSTLDIIALDDVIEKES